MKLGHKIGVPRTTFLSDIYAAFVTLQHHSVFFSNASAALYVIQYTARNVAQK